MYTPVAHALKEQLKKDAPDKIDWTDKERALDALKEQLKKDAPDKIDWTDKERALDALKAALVSQPILYPPVTSENHILYWDASTVGLGGCMAQNIDGVAGSYQVTTAQQGYNNI